MSVTEIAETRFRRIGLERLIRNGQRVEEHRLVAKMEGSALSQPFWANVNVTVWPKGGTWVELPNSRTPVEVRPRHNEVLAGVAIFDPAALHATTGKLAVRWLSQKLGRKLRPPRVPDPDRIIKQVGFHNGKPVEFQSRLYRSCLTCRWCQRIRSGTDEDEFDFRDIDGPSLREGQRDMYTMAIQPALRCLLFGMFPEEEFGILAELNEMVEAGIKNSAVVNLRFGWDSAPSLASLRHTEWHPGQELRVPADPDDTPPESESEEEPTTQDPTGEWVNINWLRFQMLRDRSCEFHREHYRKNRRPEPIPVSWMPEIEENRVLTVGATEVVIANV